jgi:VWFA-related protein
MGRFFRLFLALLLLVFAAWAQNTPTPHLQPRPSQPATVPSPAASTSGQISLDVQVTDKSGLPVRGLQKQDFTLLDDKQPQNILSFQAVDEGATPDRPAEIVLVVDAVNTSFQAITYARSELKKFLLHDGGKLAEPTSLIFFTDAGTKMQNGSSRDGNALASLYDQYETGLRTINRSQGFWGAAERFDMSIKTINSLIAYEGERPGRKLMIWFSPGWPLLTGPSIELTRKDEQQFFNSIVAASAGLRQARITLYSIDPLGLADAGGVRISYYEQFLKGVANPDRAQAADLSLQVLAVQSGGRVLNSSNDLAKEIETCVSDANAYYMLSFAAAKPDHANEYHALAVKIDKPGTQVRTRTGYYAQP